MYMLNMVIILIVMYCNVVTAIDKIPMYLLRFNRVHLEVWHGSTSHWPSSGQWFAWHLYPELCYCHQGWCWQEMWGMRSVKTRYNWSTWCVMCQSRLSTDVVGCLLLVGPETWRAEQGQNWNWAPQQLRPWPKCLWVSAWRWSHSLLSQLPLL